MPRSDDRFAELQKLATANSRLTDQGIRHALYLERLKANEAAKVVRSLNDDGLQHVMGLLDKELDRLSDQGRPTSARLNRLAGVAAEMGGMVRGGAAVARSDLRDSLKRIAATEADWQRASISAVLPATISLTAPSPAALRAVISDPIHGRTLGEWFGGLSTSAQGRLTKELRIGIASGSSPREMRNAVAAALDVTKRDAATIARTSVTHVSAKARDETYAGMEDVIKGVRWVATLDSRTTEICADLDGQVFPLNEGQRPPAHMNCRSTTVPVLKSWKEMGIPAKELSDQERASLDGQVPATTTYNEWIKGQPAEVQNEALGQAKAQMLREGKGDVHTFVGPGGKPLTVDQLREKEGLPPLRQGKRRDELPREAMLSPSDVVSIAPGGTVGLPEGWKVEVRKLASGREYKVYVAPNGKTYPSLTKAKAASGGTSVVPLPPKPPLPPPPPPPPVAGKPPVVQLGKLPAGWTVEERETANGRKYKVYISPTGKRTQSLAEAQRIAASLPKVPTADPADKPKVEAEVGPMPTWRTMLDRLQSFEQKSSSPLLQELDEKEKIAKQVLLSSMKEMNKYPTDSGKWLVENKKVAEAIRVREDLLKQLSNERARLRSAGHEILTNPNSNNTLKITHLFGPKDAGKHVAEMNEYLGRVANTSKVPSHVANYVRVGTASGGRAHYVPNKSLIMMTESNDTRIYLHEMGHLLEENVPGAVQDARAFYNSRVDRRSDIAMGKWGMPKEVGNPDDFEKAFRACGTGSPGRTVESCAAYTGKRYHPTHYQRAEQFETEVVSMGMELLYENPVAFAKTDPQWCGLILRVLTGETNGGK